MSGIDDSGQIVCPFVSAVRSGVRRSTSFFLNRLLAVENYLTYANEILAHFVIELRLQATFLYKSVLL